MSEYFNQEQYPDPTAYDAIKRVELEEKRRIKIQTGEWFMRWIYIASPYKGDIDTNTQNAKKYALFVSKQTFVPIVPHLYLTQFLNDEVEEERNAGLALGLQMLKRCHEMWLFGDYISEGMRAEMEFAEKHSIPIRYFNTDCEEVTRYGD